MNVHDNPHIHTVLKDSVPLTPYNIIRPYVHIYDTPARSPVRVHTPAPVLSFF